MLRRLPILLFVAAALGAAGCGPRGGDGGGPELQVYAAASLSEVVGELARRFEAREPAVVSLNVAASNVLAQQILAAPGADVFLSADRHWVDVLEAAGRLVAESRRPLLGNRLVLVAGKEARIAIDHPGQLAGAGYRFLALADPQAAPAGRYARAALEEIPLGDGTLWRAVAGRVAPALDVRAALALVESDPEILGVVYATDAKQSRRVRVLYEFPPSGVTRVTYYGALVAGGGQPERGRSFLEFAAGTEGRRIAARYGFEEPAT